MAARKRNPTAQTLKARIGFRISKKPLVHVAADDERDNVGDSVGRSGEYGAPILFAIARDPRTIFTSWNIDWLSLFEKAVPVDRQVHLRMYGADGLAEKTVAVEPMAAMHYLTTSGAHSSYGVEMGYYQPADVSLSDIAAARRAFDEADTEKLARRTGALLGFSASSPSRGFADSSWS